MYGNVAAKLDPDRGLSRNRRGMYIRLPVLLYDKLLRLAAIRRQSTGSPVSMNSVIVELIEQAKEKSS